MYHLFLTKYTFKDVYAYLSRLHYKTFHRLKYYLLPNSRNTQLVSTGIAHDHGIVRRQRILGGNVLFFYQKCPEPLIFVLIKIVYLKYGKT